MSMEPVLRPIGSLARQIVNSPSISGSTRLPSPRNSATTGLECRDSAAESSTGARHTAIAVERRRRATDPAQVDHELVASLPQSVRSAIHELRHEWADPQYGFHSELSGYELAPNASLTASDIAFALGQCDAALARCPAEIMRRELARLRTVTVSRDIGEDLALAMVAYAEALSEYPADVVIAACRRRRKFWPPLAELLDEADGLMMRRRALRSAIAKMESQQ